MQLTRSEIVEDDNKTESAYRMVRNAILSVELEPGMPLRPNRLQERFGIGWTPLREALARLEAERLVTTQRNRGFAVAAVSLQELEDLTKARCVLEQALLEDSLQQGDSAWEDQLIVAHFRLKEATVLAESWTRSTVLNWLTQHQKFHRALACGGKSQWLLHLYDQVLDQERRQYLALTMLPALKQLELAPKPALPTPLNALIFDAIDIREHTQLMEAALARDAQLAMRLMREHLKYKSTIFSLAK